MDNTRKKLISDLENMFGTENENNIFNSFINYIRFPFFKNFDKDLKVNFTYPITFIVGGNGAGKSSLLQALYGAPKGRSIAHFWYTTALDPIKDVKENRHCFIYSHTMNITKTKAEVLKSRIQRKKNFDYWEPARPKTGFGMIAPPEGANPQETSPSKDRWNLVDKNVHYMDFRYSLSAYDQYFYFGIKPNSKTLKSKQDVIRKHSQNLKQMFDENTSVRYHKRIAEKPVILSNDELSVLKTILGKEYTETKISKHNFYERKKGFAIRYKTTNVNYSEAYAGSGEIAVVKLVHDLMQADDYSLVLLDEPETSLHPNAQKKLINFILQQTKSKKLQVVISTHSPDIIEGMPKESIKILHENLSTNKIKIIENVHPENAFIHIGRSYSDKKIIIVEDELAKMIISKVIEETNNNDIFEVRFSPGGESRIKQEDMLVHSKEDHSRYFVVFDGDQKQEKINPGDLCTSEKNIEQLEQKVANIVGQKIKFSCDSRKEEAQKIEAMLKYLNFHYKNVFFLPKMIPEEIIWTEEILEKSDISSDKKKEIKEENNLKKKLNLFAKHMFGNNCAEGQKSIYRYCLKRWKKESKDYEKVKAILSDIRSIK